MYLLDGNSLTTWWLIEQCKEEQSICNFKVQWGLEYRTWNTEHHPNTERFKVRFSNGKKTKWRPFCSVFEWSGPFENRTFKMAALA